MDDSKLIFHYTNQEGLLGIIEDKEIWASDAFFVNDSSELNHTLNLAQKIISEKRGAFYTESFINLGHCPEGVKDLAYSQVLEHLPLIKNVLKDQAVYIASFSKNGDQLSQWRGYCHGGVGYSLGFQEKLLKKRFENDHCFKNCIYSYPKQLKAIDRFIELFEAKLESKAPMLDDLKSKPHSATMKEQLLEIINENEKDLYLLLLHYAPLCKHSKFKEECELRLVKFSNKSSIPDFRPGKSYLIPYIKVSLLDAKSIFPLKKIYIGPCPNPDLTKQSVEKLLHVKGIRDCEVLNSTIPFRNW